MKYIIQALTAVLLLSGFLAPAVVNAQDYQEVTIRELNSYEEPPQTIDDLPDHPLVDEQVTFEAIVVSNPRSSGLANFTEEDGDEIGVGRIHFFVVDVNALEEGREGMYMHVVAGDVGQFEVLERGDRMVFEGTHEFFGSTVQFNPDNAGFVGNVIADDGLSEYRELLEPMTVDVSDINEEFEDTGNYTFRPQAYEDYINAYVRFEGVEVIGSDLDDEGRPNFYWVDDQGTPMTYRDISLRYRNDRNDVAGGYRDGYNFRRVEEQAGFDPDGAFRPPPSGTISNISGFVVWDGFDFYDLNESDDHATLQLSPMEDGSLWWGTGDDLEKRTTDPNDSDLAWPDDLIEVGFPPVISNYEISSTQPGSGEQVDVSADIEGPEGEEVYGVSISWETSRGEEGSEEMQEDNGSYSYTFDAFEDFTSVEFTIEASLDAEDPEDPDGEAIQITARFSDGDADQAGNILDMAFTQVGDEITNISTIQQTIDGNRGQSPLEDLNLEDVDMEIDAVVVSDSEDAFVIVHDEAAAWSGIPLAATDEVAELERGENITITDAVITNQGENTYLDEVEFTSGGLIDDVIGGLFDYIPTISVEDATDNNGAAYEGMIIRIEDVQVATNQADAPSDFGEWAVASQADPDGRSLRVNDFPDVGDVTGDFDTTVPSDLNANMIIGAEFEAVIGYSEYSFGNPKIHLRNLDDIVTDDAFTWPVRNIDLSSPSDGGELQIDSENNIAIWDMTESYDGNEVSYTWVFAEANDGTIDEPLVEVSDVEVDEEEGTVTAQIPQGEIEDAFADAGFSQDESGEFAWSVHLSHDGVDDAVQVATIEDAEFQPVANNITVGYGDVVSSEDDDELPRTVELNQNYPNPFNPATTIEYQVPEQTDVRLTVYDVLGREVSTLVNEEQTAGTYTVSFDGSDLASGMYIYRLEAGSTAITKQMMLVK